jgi:hypothetical protein
MLLNTNKYEKPQTNEKWNSRASCKTCPIDLFHRSTLTHHGKRVGRNRKWNTLFVKFV